MLKLLAGTKNIFLGLLLALSLPPVSQLWAGVVALSILMFFESKLQIRGSFWRGLLFGFGYFAFALHWIGFAFLVDAEAYLWMMPFAVGGLALFMACYWGLAFSTAWALHNSIKVPLWLTLATSLAGVEWLRGHLFTGFPWATPGLMADGSASLLQVASLVGMPGLTFLVLMWGVLPAAVFLHLRQSKHTAIYPLLLLFTLPAAWWWGGMRLEEVPQTAVGQPLIRLVQPNIAQSDKWRSDNAVRIFEDLMALSARPAVRRPDVIIWPESSLPFLLDESPEALQRIGDMLLPGQSLLAGSIRRERDAGCNACPERYFTSILSINDAGVVVGRYDKWRLVPGGEYLPLAWLLEPFGFRKVVNLPESFSAGPGPVSLDVAGIGPAAMLICYEAIFPHELFSAEERPRWIVNVTNDGWFGKSVGPYQHLAQVRMRAVEQGVPVARAANTGISALIDSHGRVLARSTLELRNIVDSGLPNQIPATIYARLGDYCLLMLVLAIFSTWGFVAYFSGNQFTRK